MMPVMGEDMEIVEIILKCRKCGLEGRSQFFKKSKQYKNGYDSICKKCHVENTKILKEKYNGMETPTSKKKRLSDIGIKICISCKKEKSFDSFYKTHKVNGRRHSMCIECVQQDRIDRSEQYMLTKTRSKNKTLLTEYLQFNKEWHCIKKCAIHGKLPYEKIGIHQKLEKGCRTARLYCIPCKQKRNKHYINEERKEERLKSGKPIKCTSCKMTRSLCDYSLSTLKHLHARCLDCMKKIQKRSEDSRMMIKRYGFKLSVKDFNKMLEEQNGVCKICGGINKNKRLAIDHCHRSGEKGIVKIRGLLCSACNVSLGGFKDSPELLRKAAQYLEES